MSSTAEAGVGTVHHNGKASIPVRTVLDDMGHPQGSTPVKIDNNTAKGFSIKNPAKKKKIIRYEVPLDDRSNPTGEMLGILGQRGE